MKTKLVLTIIALFICFEASVAAPRPVFDTLFGFNLNNVQQQNRQVDNAQYQYYKPNNGYYRDYRSPQQYNQPQQQPSRNYKDMCRLISHDAFLNPGGGSKCPY